MGKSEIYVLFIFFTFFTIVKSYFISNRKAIVISQKMPFKQKKIFSCRLRPEIFKKIKSISKKINKSSKFKFSQADIVELSICMIENEKVDKLIGIYTESLR